MQVPDLFCVFFISQEIATMHPNGHGYSALCGISASLLGANWLKKRKRIGALPLIVKVRCLEVELKRYTIMKHSNGFLDDLVVKVVIHRH